MYQNIYINKKDWIVHLWDDIDGYKSFAYPKYAYKKQAGGNERSIYGDELVKVFNYNDNDPELFESDVPAETRILIDTYKDSDEPSKGHKIGVIDIEVSTEGGFPNMDTADKEITGISLFDTLTKTCYVFILDKDHKIDNKEEETDPWLPKDWKITTDEERQKVKIVTRSFDDEDDLLIKFMDKWQECGFTIVTGWNCIDENTYISSNKSLKKIKDIDTSDVVKNYGTILNKGISNKKYVDIVLADGRRIKASDES